MTATKSRLTEEELMSLPDDGLKHEYVDGEVTDVPTGGVHEDIGAILTILLGPHALRVGRIYGSGLGCWMRSGNVRSPDVSVVRSERLPGGRSGKGFFQGAPDLCVEIISPSENRRDMERKVREYFESGAQQVWHVLPKTREVIVFGAAGTQTRLGPEDTLTGGDVVPGFECRVADLFEGAA